MNKLTDNSGFTLIETVIAIAVFTIGILALYGLVTMSIKGNATAITVTTAANWAQDRVEKVLAMDYEDLDDTNNNNCGGLDDYPNSDYKNNDDANYTIYWNVANDCWLKDIPDAPTTGQEQKPKHVRFIVTKENWGVGKKVVLNYIKQNTM